MSVNIFFLFVGLSYEELVAQCLIFFVAGYETTAATLAFASYSLALNSDVQEKLIQEIDDALRKNNVSKLSFLFLYISLSLSICNKGVKKEQKKINKNVKKTRFTDETKS